MSSKDRDELERQLEKRLRQVVFSELGEESNYNPALVQALKGFKFSGTNFGIFIGGAPMTSDGKGSSESSTGADMSIYADIFQGTDVKRKAVLIQAKRESMLHNKRELDRLKEQIKTMQKITSHPKVLVIKDRSGGFPVIISGQGFLQETHFQEIEFARWLARRFVRTFDGDRDAELCRAARSPDLNRIWVKAEFTPSTR
jgi:hypothetical protein